MRNELEELDDLTVRAVEALSRDEVRTPSVLRLLLRRYAMTGRDDLAAVLGPGLAQALEVSAADAGENERSAWLELFVEAAMLSRDERVRDAAAGLAARIVEGFPSVENTGRTVAGAMRSIYACLHAADLFAETDAASSLIRESVDALECLIGPLYRPGNGMPHLVTGLDRAPGTLSDHMHTASALIAAHAWTGRLPYSMLAEELVQFARRSCWPAADKADDLEQFVASCETVTVLCRLAALHADPAYREAAVVAPDGDYATGAGILLRERFETARRLGIDAAAQFGLAVCDWLSLEP